MNFVFNVHYRDPDNEWKTKKKKVRAKDKEQAMEKFKEKFPDLEPIFAE